MGHKGKGRLEVIRGCMFSGKTEEMGRRLKRLSYAKQSYMAFKHCLDTRYSREQIATHDGSYKIEAVPVSGADNIIRKVYADQNPVDVVAIDEVMFFNDWIVDCVNFMVDAGYRVIVAGLDTDYRGKVFGSMGELLAIADEDVHLFSVCSICGGQAVRTQLMINGEPAILDDKPLILVGGTEAIDSDKRGYGYQARCRNHHEVITKDKQH